MDKIYKKVNLIISTCVHYAVQVGVAESGVMLSLAHHFDTLEAERCIGRLEMRRVKVRAAGPCSL